MKTTYKCKICGLVLNNKTGIQKCEARGNQHNKFSVDQKVVFLLAPGGIRRWTRAKVHNVRFAEMTHEPSYELFIHDDFEAEDQRLSIFKNTIISVSEKHVYFGMEEIDLKSVDGLKLKSFLQELKEGEKLELTFKKDGFRGATHLWAMAKTGIVRVDYLHDLSKAIKCHKWESDDYRIVTATITYHFQPALGPTWFVEEVYNDLQVLKIIR